MKLNECGINEIIGVAIGYSIVKTVNDYFGIQGFYLLMLILVGMFIFRVTKKS